MNPAFCPAAALPATFRSSCEVPRLCQIALIGYPEPEKNRAGQVVSAALALLFARERRGEAGYQEIALSVCADKYAESSRYGLTIPGGVLGGGSPQYNLYQTRQGWLAVAALETHFWERLTRELGIPGEAGYDELSRIFRTRTTREWEDWALMRDLPIAAVR